MGQLNGRTTYTRRNFLRATGTLAASAALWGAARPVAAAATGKALHLGIALPTTVAHPHLHTSLLAGLKLYFAQQPSTSPVLRYAPIDASGSALQTAVAALLATGPLDCIIGMTTPTVAALLRQELARHNTCFINATVGANLPRETDQSAQILHSSLAHWQSSWALGRWAASNIGKRAIMTASLYDSGYDAFYAFQLGFESQGGTIIATQVNSQNPTQEDLAALPFGAADLVYAAYSGPAAVAFVQAYATLATQCPLLGSTFLTDEAILRSLGTAALNIQTAASWSPTLETPGNQAFTTAYQAQTGHAPDMLAVLGFDTARLIDQLYQQTSAPTLYTAGLLRGFAVSDRPGPRGAMTFERQSQTLTTPLYLRTVRPTAAGYANVALQPLPGPAANDPAIAALYTTLKTGWTTPYLCQPG